MTRVSHRWIEKVEGIDFKLASLEELKYDGKWDHIGYEVYWLEEGPHKFVGYPTDSDLKELIKL
jgi:hypothetical protein